MCLYWERKSSQISEFSFHHKKLEKKKTKPKISIRK